MRRHIVPILVTVAVLIAFVAAGSIYLKAIAPRFAEDAKVLHSPSDIKLSLRIDYKTGPLLDEQYFARDENGVSTISYRALGRNGVKLAIDEEPSDTIASPSNVAFLFGKVAQDGVWDLPDRPPRGNTNVAYTVSAYQSIDNLHGGRSFTFTDPHYWATTGGHQYTIHLDRDKPLPDLLHLSNSTPVEPRYERIVADFVAFGPKSYLERIASEKKRQYGPAA